MNIALHLQIVGVLQWLLAALHFVLPQRFGRKEDLARLSLINRQIFIVHCMFIVLLLLLLGALNVFYTDLLLAPNPLAPVVLSGLGIFWTVRLYAQWFLYSPKLWRGNRFNTIMHYTFTAMWAYYVVVYGIALWQSRH